MPTERNYKSRNMSMTPLDRRISRMDRRLPFPRSNVERLTDADLEHIILAGLRQHHPEVAARYAAANSEERFEMLTEIGQLGGEESNR